MNAFRLGDVVRSVSGGPKMTIEGICDDEIACVWFARVGTSDAWQGPFRDRFRAALLVPVNPPVEFATHALRSAFSKADD